MKLEAGKYYKDRAGNTVGPMEMGRYGEWKVSSHSVDGYLPMYLEDGRSDFFWGNQDPKYDLIEEVTKQ